MRYQPRPAVHSIDRAKVFDAFIGPDAKKLIFKRQGKINDTEYYLCRIGKYLYFGEKRIFHVGDEFSDDELRKDNQGVDGWQFLKAVGTKPTPWRYYSLNGLKLDWTYKEVPIMEIIYMSLNYVFELYD